jgi:ribosome recycling factor
LTKKVKKMNEDIQFILDSTKEAMHNAIKHLEKQFVNIRAGKASPAMLGSVMVDYYGSQTPLNQLANVTAPEARLLVVQPYDKSSMEDIEKAIMASGLGLNPNNDGQIIRIPLPMLSEERRKDLVKHAKEVAEK